MRKIKTTKESKDQTLLVSKYHLGQDEMPFGDLSNNGR